ncbi:MAG: KTSC domain-containing protein [Oscillospiraceae bacterium]|nr:KTSC domain-containing protein [Oscillospiraceae bacterium]
MEEIKISSSIIDSVSYYGKIMFVKLQNDKLLSYNSVPHSVYEEFIKADAHDEFYTKKIISAFPSRRMA